MSKYALSLVALAAATATPMALADQDGFRTTNNEAGSEFVAPAGTLTRDQVRRDLDAARRDGTLRLFQRSSIYPPEGSRAGFVSSREEASQATRLRDAAASSGWVYVGGEAGWVYARP